MSLIVKLPAQAFRRRPKLSKVVVAKDSRPVEFDDLVETSDGEVPQPTSENVPSSDSSTTSATVNDAASYITEAVLLEWLGQPPISFHRMFVDITGGILPGLWLSTVMFQMHEAPSEAFTNEGNYKFQFSYKLCRDSTGMCQSEQRKAQKVLIELGVLEVESLTYRQSRLAITNPTPNYQLRLNRLTELMKLQSADMAANLAAIEDNSYEISPEILDRKALARSIRSMRQA